jgi:5'-nucleotidase
MKKTFFIFPLIIVLISFVIHGKSYEGEWPKRVLITNDDGIQDVRLIKLARTLSETAETWVVAPMENRSGSAHYISVFSKHSLSVEEVFLGDGIYAYGVDGYPGDCILLALKGLMRDNPPDLVISGINDGPNLGFDWIVSGTIGAARIAAYWGVPAVAVSGMNEDIPDALDSACRWIVELSKSDLVRKLKAKQYLTVSIPRISPAEIKGIKIAKRAGILLDFSFSQAQKQNGETVWQMLPPKKVEDFLSQSDAVLYYAGYIVIVPMRADEDDDKFILALSEKKELIPQWIGSCEKK